MKTIELAELRRIREQARIARRDNEIQQDARRWSREDASYDWLSVILVFSAIMLVVVIGYSLLHGFAENEGAEIRARQIVADCRNDGGTAHVDRDAAGHVLAARCERGGE